MASTLADVAMQKLVVQRTMYKCVFCRPARLIRKSWSTRMLPRAGEARKKAVRTDERPKSREETPKVGCGSAG